MERFSKTVSSFQPLTRISSVLEEKKINEICYQLIHHQYFDTLLLWTLS